MITLKCHDNFSHSSGSHAELRYDYISTTLQWQPEGKHGERFYMIIKENQTTIVMKHSLMN